MNVLEGEYGPGRTTAGHQPLRTRDRDDKTSPLEPPRPRVAIDRVLPSSSFGTSRAKSFFDLALMYAMQWEYFQKQTSALTRSDQHSVPANGAFRIVGSVG